MAEIDTGVDKDPPQARSMSCLPDTPFTPMAQRACACHGRPDVPPISVCCARRASGQLTPTLAGCAPHQFYSLCRFPLVSFLCDNLLASFIPLSSKKMPSWTTSDTGRCDSIGSFSAIIVHDRATKLHFDCAMGGHLNRAVPFRSHFGSRHFLSRSHLFRR